MVVLGLRKDGRQPSSLWVFRSYRLEWVDVCRGHTSDSSAECYMVYEVYGRRRRVIRKIKERIPCLSKRKTVTNQGNMAASA